MKPNFLFLFFLVGLFLSAIFVAETVQATLSLPSATFTVNDTTDLIDDNVFDGVCRTANNTCTLRAAVMQSNALSGAHTINVPAGTFVLTVYGSDPNYDGTAGDLNLKGNLTINGAGVQSTIIDGSAIDRVFDIDNTAIVTISGVTIQNGNVRFNSGGAIRNQFNGRLTLSDTRIFSSTSLTWGGGIYNNGTVILTNVIVDGNFADQGGGIWNTGTITVTQSTLSNNQCTAYAGGVGNTGSAYFANTIITANRAFSNASPTTALGGGFLNSGNAILSNVTIISNTASYHSGGIVTGGNLTIFASTIMSNSAIYSAGMLATGTLTMNNSTVLNNQSAFGGIVTIGGVATLTNVTVSGNSAGAMAGIDNAGQITLTNVTINNNQVTRTPNLATSIYNGYNSTSVVYLKNTIVANDGSFPNCKSDMGIGIISLGNNLNSDNTCNLTSTGDLTNTNPFLGPLANNGGATLTHALLTGSPAIDKGTNIGCPPTDQRGMPRPLGARCDIGAYEFSDTYPFALILPVIRK